MPPRIKKTGTRTAAFGSPGRVSHDSRAFYGKKLYAGQPQEDNTPYRENPLPEAAVNTIFCRSAEDMAELPDSSIHLMVTSPPYNVGKDYDEDFTLEEYLGFLKRVWREVHRVLVPGGRACINVANLGRKPYIPLHAYIIRDMVDLGFLMRGEIIWDKGASAAASTAWGSWKSPANPTLRDVHEYILVFLQGEFLPEKTGRPGQHHLPGGISGIHQECLDLPGGIGQKSGAPGPLSGGAALSPDAAVHLRRRGGPGPLHGERPDRPGGPEGRAPLRGL
jgi:modification methylase